MSAAYPHIELTDSDAERLNRTCFCITLDRDALCRALEREAGDSEFCKTFVRTRANLFSNVPVFLPAPALAKMHTIVAAIEAAARLPGYRSAVLSWAPKIAHADRGPLGAFMGYDFHLHDDGPRLIEVNTNAGGAFLNAWLARAQRACCAEVEHGLATGDDFEGAVLRMFNDEWLRQRNSNSLHRIAIVDDRPDDQYLYPEFVLAQQMLLKAGIDAMIADASELRYESGRLLARGEPVELVYNRLVDFALDRPEHLALRAAYADGAVVLTPNPHNHALLADKRNLTLLSDPVALAAWGLPPEFCFGARKRAPDSHGHGRQCRGTLALPEAPVFQTSLRTRQQGCLSRRQGDSRGVGGNHPRRLCGARTCCAR